MLEEDDTVRRAEKKVAPGNKSVIPLSSSCVFPHYTRASTPFTLNFSARAIFPSRRSKRFLWVGCDSEQKEFLPI
jgi:2'-5' RNA ligase